ncbi:DctP family TRAP transporter solute-binding subunit [bacterium LRH843]|nr:DctP family TRAP transporter solute-binding subunit [bacterium LRH843]
MKRKWTLLFIVFALLSLLLVGCGGKEAGGEAEGEKASEEKVYKMKLGHANPPGDPKDVSANYFADLVNERSDGRIQIEVFPGGTLGDWRELVEGLSLGQNEIVIESIGTMNAYSDFANIDAVPYLYRDFDHFTKVWKGEIGKEIMDKVGADSNIQILGPQYRGGRIVTSKKPFSNLEEIKGLDIRTPGIDMYIETWKRLGANPTPMALTEVYTGLQQGTVQAQENPLANSYDFGFHEVAPYLIMTNHVYSASVFMFDQDYFNALPEDLQEIIKVAAEEAADYRGQYVLDIEEEYLQKYIDDGVEVIYPEDTEIIAAFDGFVEEVFPYLSETVERIRAVE